jgi:hypothetical protein
LSQLAACDRQPASGVRWVSRLPEIPATFNQIGAFLNQPDQGLITLTDERVQAAIVIVDGTKMWTLREPPSTILVRKIARVEKRER